jgi:hypothetical protein
MEGSAEDRLREKLTAFYNELPEDERAAFSRVLAPEDGDDVGGFIWGAMLSRFNQAETLASSMRKKDNEPNAAVIQKRS